MNDFPSVWLVDDDEDDLYIFKTAFKQLFPHLDIRLFFDGEELLPALTAASLLPKLVLLDLNMPKQNGFVTLRMLRFEERFQQLPVIILTTSSSTDDHETSYFLGANEVLIKPATQNEIRDIILKLNQDWKIAGTTD
jgi:CheY-like chemotaxis protein